MKFRRISIAIEMLGGNKKIPWFQADHRIPSTFPAFQRYLTVDRIHLAQSRVKFPIVVLIIRSNIYDNNSVLIDTKKQRSKNQETKK